MAMPSELLGNSDGSGSDMPVLTPQWMLHRSTSNSVLESNAAVAAESAKPLAPEDRWRSTSSSRLGEGKLPPTDLGSDRSSRWRDEERDGHRELGSWSSLPTRPDPLLEAVRSSKLTEPVTGPGDSRWDSSFGRGRGVGFDSRPVEAHNWGATRTNKRSDRWDAGELPGMSGTRPSLPSSKFPDTRSGGAPPGDSWRSSGGTGTGQGGLPPSLSGSSPQPQQVW
eukprot:CAMPEP_0117680406 /NCGR_PEP_ID=MMETSP0804-20121206/18335_1 /TAXON_ID=1074897 /ORGANISM="Tetraselmis astigmatica, Strain CCMP880" /LENGTH=223 /DNA_ID=CAMNT_0005489901 /DNA_START=180 /DNA_END=849 /DNA_ORIENTATION=+